MMSINLTRVAFLLLLLSSLCARADMDPPKHFTNSIGMKFVRIPSGSFRQYLVDKNGDKRDVFRTVAISRMFYLSQTEVTQSQWLRVMKSNPSYQAGGNRPVEMVNWFDAVEYCKRLSQIEGKRYRLPTVAEWQYSCFLGERLHPQDKDGWFVWNSPNGTGPVAKKRPNKIGLFDVYGNVFEWCADWDENIRKGKASDPQGPKRGRVKVTMGGSILTSPDASQPWQRRGISPEVSRSDLGFRVVYDPQK